MSKSNITEPDDRIVTLNMNGLQGRMLILPPRGNKKRDILLVYGHHASIEYWTPLAEELTRYGNVTVPDLPGFGGMTSLYRIGEKPTVDKLADYLAAFVKLRYKRRRPTIIGIGFGFVVATRMLGRYPELAKRIDVVVSVAGFTSHDDIKVSNQANTMYKLLVRLGKIRLPAWLLKTLVFHSPVLGWLYQLEPRLCKSLQTMCGSSFHADPGADIQLWRHNDVRTHMATTLEVLKLDNCSLRVSTPAWHVSLSASRDFDTHVLEQHMRVVFSNFHEVESGYDSNSAATDKQTLLLPSKLRRILNKA